MCDCVELCTWLYGAMREREVRCVSMRCSVLAAARCVSMRCGVCACGAVCVHAVRCVCMRCGVCACGAVCYCNT